MHRDVDLIRQLRAVDFAGEERATADGPQRDIGAHIAFGLDVHQLHIRRTGLGANQIRDPVRLPQRQRRSARADAQGARAHDCSPERKR